MSLLKRIAGGFGVKVSSTFAGFIFNVVLGRTLGPAGSGAFALAQAASVFGATMGKVGLDNTVVRYVSMHSVEGEDRRAEARSVLATALRISFLMCLVASATLFLFAPQLAHLLQENPGPVTEQNIQLVRLASMAVIPYALSTLIGQAFIGLKRPSEGLTIQLLIMPLTGSVFALALIPNFGLKGAVWAYTASAFAALAYGALKWRAAMAGEPREAAAVKTRELLASCMPLFLMAITQFLLKWSPVVLIRIWSTVADVGIFNVALRTAFLLTFILSAVNASVSPLFSELYQKGDLVELGRVARRCAQAMMVFAGVPLLLILVAPGWIMGLYGPGFVRGGPALIALALGQFVNVSTGSVQQLMMMTGREKRLGQLYLYTLPIHFLLMWLLTPRYGAIGAGIAVGLVFAIQNLSCALLVKRELGIWTLPTVSDFRNIRQDVGSIVRRIRKRSKGTEEALADGI